MAKQSGRTSALPTKLTKENQASLVEFLKNCSSTFTTSWDLRTKLERIDKAYAREVDRTIQQAKAKAANLAGDTDAMRNVVMPVVMPQVEAAVTYQASVFLTGSPLFGVVTTPDAVDVGIQMETVIDNQAREGGWTIELIRFLRDNFKYNLAAVECDWVTKSVPNLASELGNIRPSSLDWSGNDVNRLDLYNTFFDTRVAPVDIPSKGEFVGYRERYSRIALKQLLSELSESIVANHKDALESTNPNKYYTPDIIVDLDMPDATDTNWLAWAGLDTSANKGKQIDYKNSYEVTTLYARILPSDFGISVPAPNSPQVWKLTFVNDEVLVEAKKLTNAHNLLPVLFSQVYDDGLTYQTKSLAENVEPMQAASTTMLNSVLAARRRAIYDRTVYDPSLISSKDVNSPNPISNIPLKPSAYGRDVRTAITQMPFNDSDAGLLLNEIGTMNSLADVISGQNKAQQGQFVKGNKTREEYADVMGNANGKNQVISISLEAQFFSKLKKLLKINILQYQGGTTLYNTESKKLQKVDPAELRNAVLEFKLSDGLLPSDKLLNQTAFQTALQVIGSSPRS